MGCSSSAATRTKSEIFEYKKENETITSCLGDEEIVENGNIVLQCVNWGCLWQLSVSWFWFGENNWYSRKM